jgi:phosphoadenosine phosphosulfate reductase
VSCGRSNPLPPTDAYDSRPTRPLERRAARQVTRRNHSLGRRPGRRTYKHAEHLRSLLKLNLKPYLPRISAAHRDAVCGPIPTLDDETGLKQFSAQMKLEPFQRGMKELAPSVWITALRRVQNPHRAELDILSPDPNFGTLKVSPLFYWTDAQIEDYLTAHNLPNEWDYFDPAKADEKRECGLHATWGGKMVSA